MKISANSIKQEVREKELEQERSRLQITQAQLKIKEEQVKRNKLLDEVLLRCLNAAIDGENFLDIGFEYPGLDDVLSLLEAKFIEIVEISGEEYILREIKGTLEALNQKQHGPMDKILHARARDIKFCLGGPDMESYYGFDELAEFIDLSLDDENSLEETIVYLFKASAAYKEIDLDFDDEITHKTKENIEITNAEIADDFREINGVFEYLNLKELPEEDDIARILKWLKMEDDDVINYWDNEFLDGYSFAYLATHHGQLFVSAFKNAVEEKMSSHNQSLELQLLKYSSGYLIRLENKAEVYTIYDEAALNKFFKKLGYSVKFKDLNNDEFNFVVSWNN